MLEVYLDCFKATWRPATIALITVAMVLLVLFPRQAIGGAVIGCGEYALRGQWTVYLVCIYAVVVVLTIIARYVCLLQLIGQVFVIAS